ncbi:hypothetical protein PHYPSEUDO_013507 [Phytophthora pseudosyringae]|uniref:Uncharacterized protein n=1 Tax=Phytophthora pseudosyringae TaxID=221518 RepID=A0A8T1WMR1_9STRA|nr:hypothetical protein PHYPSEUDO_013507 [Phytophthora pseudosyringae]
MHSTLRRYLLRLVVVAGAAVGVALLTIIVSRPRTSAQERVLCWPTRDRNRGCSGNVKRNLQNELSNSQPGVPFHGENHVGPPQEHHHEYKHRDHDRENDDDDADSEDDDDGKNDDDDNSESSSQSGSSSSSSSSSGRESAAIQSSVVTNLDGVNIGNTITIINIGTGSQPNASGSADNAPNGNASGNLAVDGAGRSAITSAAVRAFCDSMNCSNFSNPATTAVTSSGSATFSAVAPTATSGNAARVGEAQYELPSLSSGSSVAKLSTWVLLVAILVQIR